MTGWRLPIVLIVGLLPLLSMQFNAAVAVEPASAGQSDRPLVTFFYGGIQPTDSWLSLLNEIGAAAADDLEMDFETVYSGPSRKEMFDTVKNRIETGTQRPDYVLFVNFRGGAELMIEYADSQGIDSFLINADLAEDAEARIGGPREQMKHWIGRLIPDDEQAGYDLATVLFEKARQNTTRRPVNVVGITGSYSSTASVKRDEGLRRAARDNPDVALRQIVSARWAPLVAAEKYALLKNRYGKFDVVWVANDQMALSVLGASEAAGDETVIGGMDWTVQALEAIRQGRLSASMGGHFLDIGLALAVIKRYDEGCDFAEHRDEASLSSVLSVITPQSEEFNVFIEGRDWSSLDFTVLDCDTMQAENFGEIAMDRLLETVIGSRG